MVKSPLGAAHPHQVVSQLEGSIEQILLIHDRLTGGLPAFVDRIDSQSCSANFAGAGRIKTSATENISAIDHPIQIVGQGFVPSLAVLVILGDPADGVQRAGASDQANMGRVVVPVIVHQVHPVGQRAVGELIFDDVIAGSGDRVDQRLGLALRC